MATAAYDKGRQQSLVIACGALAREILAVIRQNDWSHLNVTCLPANLHNRPEKIPEAVRAKIRAVRGAYANIYVAYADCGTGGVLDKVLAEEGVERIGGPHCYAFFSGVENFLDSADDDPTCFYLTDYLVRHFDRLMIQGLGLDRHPELLSAYFGNYTKLVYLAQSEDDQLKTQAKAAAERLGLSYEYRFTGYGELQDFLQAAH